MRQCIAKILFVTATLLMGCGATAWAQQLKASRSHYSTDNGLSSNAIAVIKQDDMGFIWIGTWNGLSRFDGYQFYNYKTGAASHIPNLHNRIFDIAFDAQQNVWMRMYDGHVFVMRRSTDRIVNPFSGINGNEDFRTSCPVMVASNGDVLASIDGVGIYRIRPERNSDFAPQLFTTSGLTITCMAEGYKGDIWLGTDKGIHLLDPNNMTVKREGQFTDEHITCIFSDRYNIFAGTRSGKIVTFAYGTKARELRHGGQPINAVYVDSHKLVWFTDDRQGASRLDPATGEEKLFMQTLLVPDYDGQGGKFHESKDETGDSTTSILWVRMNHGGYGYYNRKEDMVEYFHNDPTNPWNLLNTVNASLELDEGVVFESTGRRGLEKLELMKNTIVRTLLVPDATSTLENETRAIYYDEKRHVLLIGNKAGTLYLYDDKGNVTHTITHDDNGNPIGRSYGISEDSKGNYWLSSKDNGLFRITPSANGTYSVVNMRHSDDDAGTLSSNSAYATVEDSKGNIWVATYGGGVNVLTRDKKGQQVFLHHKNGMTGYPYRSHLKVRTIATDRDGNVWAGTTDGILIMSVSNGEVKIGKLEQSEEYPDSILMSNDVVCLGRDRKGSMWIGTNGGGIAHTTGKDHDGRWLIANYGAKDGLPGEEIKSLTFDTKGNVWFTTDNVICCYDTDKNIFTNFTNLDGVDDTMCSEGGAATMGKDKVLIGTVNGYYIVDRKRLENNNASALKLHITDFWLNDELQSPRLNDNFDIYVPESREITLNSHSSRIALRFASLNYQLQHRMHYQYMLEGYDKQWRNADKNRTASYPALPTGRYTFKVKAFLLESPEWADTKELVIVVPPYFLASSKAIWFYMLLAAVLGITLMFWRQKRILAAQAPQAAGSGEDATGLWKRMTDSIRRKERPKKNDNTDYYEILD